MPKLNTFLKQPYRLYQKYLTEILILFYDDKSISQVKSKMNLKFPVPVHHDIPNWLKHANVKHFFHFELVGWLGGMPVWPVGVLKF